MGGKLVLIRSVLQSLPLHVLTAANPPRGILIKLEKIFANFLWGVGEDGPKHHWIAWKALCRPTEEDGFGIRSLNDIYLAFSAKLWWRFLLGNSLWASFLAAKYGSRGEFEEIQPRLVDSLTWKRMLDIRGSIQDCIISTDNGFIWGDTTTGDFTMKSAYNRVGDVGTTTLFGSNIWHNGIPLKISIFMMRLWKNRLPLDISLRRFGIHGPSKCCCCHDGQEESLDHVFLHGDWARYLWRFFGMPFGLADNCVRHRDILIRWWSAGGNPAMRLVFRILPSFISWGIWKMRCSAKFDGAAPPISLVIEDIIDSISFVLQDSLSIIIPVKQWHELVVSVERYIRTRKVSLVQWYKPPLGFFKLNTDGASRGNPGPGGGGGIVRDDMGRCVFAFALPMDHVSSLEAETKSLLQGLKLCAEFLPNAKVMVELDSKVLIDMCAENEKIPWKLAETITEILSFSFVEGFYHCYREANKAADFLANLGCSMNGLTTYRSHTLLPCTLRGILTLDRSGLPSLRIRSA